MKAPILNREFQHPPDGWYQIEPAGEHANARADVVQVIDEKACAAIVENFNREAAKPGFPGMLIDQEHFKHDLSKETRAFGWLMRVTNRPDGIYGQIKWTGSGRAAVDQGDYRFFSTEYAAPDLQTVRHGFARPLRLHGLTLTNTPNNHGGKPITFMNRQPDSAISAGLQPAAMERFTAIVNVIMDRSGRSFAESWNEAQRHASGLWELARSGSGDASLLNRQVDLPYDALDELEPRAREFMRKAWQGTISWPEDGAFSGFLQQLRELQLANPTLGFDQLWAAFRESASAAQRRTFWQFVRLWERRDVERQMYI